MSDEVSQLPWTSQHWADLRAVAQDSAGRSRVASTFLPLVGPLPPEQSTVPANWMTTVSLASQDQRGEAKTRLEIRSGKTLHLVTIACNVYLRGSEIADPELNAAKALVRRAAEVLGRLEDAIVFHGLLKNGEIPKFDNRVAVVQPVIYTINGGRDLTGLLQAPDTYFRSCVDEKLYAEFMQKYDNLKKARGVPGADVSEAKKEVDDAERQHANDIMSVRVEPSTTRGPRIVEAIVRAIEKLESKGHFGPFGVVLGHGLFSEATSPTGSLVLPSDRLVEFLDGRRVTRSGTLPPEEGVVVALGGQPIELVLATDMDIKFLQVTLEPRYVLRVLERFVLRIKELDALCKVTKAETLLTPGFVPRRAES